MKIKLLLCFLCMFWASFCFAQAYSTTDTTFFDKDWKPTSRANYEYYRTVRQSPNTMPPLKLLKIEDHYKDGIIQMDGYVLTEDTSKEMGLYRWYKKDGGIISARLFDYHKSIRYFNSVEAYLNKAEPCDSANVDLRVMFRKGKVLQIGFIPTGNIYDTCFCKTTCVFKQYNMFNQNLWETWEYKNGIKEGWYKFYSDGVLRKQKFYKNGQKTGIKMKYDYHGKLKKVKGLPKE